MLQSFFSESAPIRRFRGTLRNKRFSAASAPTATKDERARVFRAAMEVVMSESDLIALGRLPFERDIFGSYSGALGQPQACCGVVSNGCVSALTKPLFNPSAAPLPPPKPAIACTS
jgi:hypothetical protein